MRWYFAAWLKYATFSGRACPKEYWRYMLIHILIILVLLAGMGMIGIDNTIFSLSTILLLTYILITFLPSLALTVRRLHDLECSG